MRPKIAWSAFAAATLLSICQIGALRAAEDPPQLRSWSELVAETQTRADHQAYPETGLKPDEVRAQLATMHSFNRDKWADAWIALGDRYAAKAEADGQDAQQRRSDLVTAWHYYAFGRWPVTISPEQYKAHEKAKATFIQYAKMLDPPIEQVEIPFNGKTIYANLQLPKNIRPAPLVISIGGVDSWRDVVAVANQPFVQAGIGSLALDMPGVGESPVKNRPEADQMFDAVFDWLKTRPDIDAKRVVVRGQSWGGYWAARAGYHDASRLCGVVDQGGPADAYFTAAWQRPSLKSKEYLFDFVQSRLFVWGQDTVAHALAFLPTMSLKAGGLIDKPTPPMLLIDGVHDTQTPFADLELVLTHGSPKDAWVNPGGGHMGRSPDMNDGKIFRTIVLPWIVQHLATGCLPQG